MNNNTRRWCVYSNLTAVYWLHVLRYAHATDADCGGHSSQLTEEVDGLYHIPVICLQYCKYIVFIMYEFIDAQVLMPFDLRWRLRIFAFRQFTSAKFSKVWYTVTTGYSIVDHSYDESTEHLHT